MWKTKTAPILKRPTGSQISKAISVVISVKMVYFFDKINKYRQNQDFFFMPDSLDKISAANLKKTALISERPTGWWGTFIF